MCIERIGNLEVVGVGAPAAGVFADEGADAALEVAAAHDP
jgi:hypothetical protein